MSQIARGLFEDLKQRGLLPVAALLLVALVAVPVLMLKKSEPAPPAATAATANVSVAGLPNPDMALDQGKPLVSLAVLDQPSNLDSFESKNPFKPMNALAKSASQSSNTSAAAGAGAGAGSNGTATAGGGSGSAPAGGGSSSGGAPPSGGSTPPAATPPTNQTPPTTQTPGAGPTKPKSKPKPQQLTYALDLTVTTPKGRHRHLSVARLRMFPSESDPLFIYLGVDDTGNKAVFLVDSSLTFTGGEGTCRPSKTSCATVSVEPGEIATFQNDQSEKYQLQIDQIRLVSTASAAKAARVRERRGAQASVGTSRRFVPPVISDLFDGVGP